MKKFKWRLQKVLEIKKKEELYRTNELFQLTRRLAQTQGELLMLNNKIKTLLRQISQAEPGRRLIEQQLFLKYSKADDEKIKELKKNLSELEKQQKEKIAEVLQIRRSKQALEKLREKARLQYIAEQDKLEQKELDDRASVAFARNNSSDIRSYSTDTKNYNNNNSIHAQSGD